MRFQKKFVFIIFLLTLLFIESVLFKVQVKCKGKSYKIQKELSEDCISPHIKTNQGLNKTNGKN